jgi:capsular polysaccharide biosynthesis protein
MLLVVLTTGVLAFLAPPTYSATATVFAAAPTTGAARSVSFAQVVSSNSLATSVIQKSKTNLEVTELQDKIHAGIAGPNLYSVTVTDQDPNQANQLAAAVADQAVVLYRDLAAQTGISSADKALLKARDQLAEAYSAAVTARLKFQAQHPSAFDPKAAIRDVDVTAQALKLQLQEDTASVAYRQVLAQVSKQGLDQISRAQDYNAFVLDQPVATPNAESRVPEILFAGAVALLVGIGLAFLLEHFSGRSLLEAEAVEEMIGAPVIGIIPRANSQVLRKTVGGRGSG